MNRLTTAILTVVLMSGVNAAASADESGFDTIIAPFFERYCIRCHGAEKQEADFSLRGLTAKLSGEGIGEYEKALEMVSIGDMPPETKLQPTKAERDRFTGWVTERLRELGRGPDALEIQYPKYANRVSHEDLFSGEHNGPAYTESRVWRMNAHIYGQLMEDLDLSRDFAPPLAAMRGEGFDDYAVLYADEATIRTMIQNGKRVAMNIVHGRLVVPRGAAEKDPKNVAHRRHTRHRVLAEFGKIQGEPTRQQMETAARYASQLLLKRAPTEEELERHVTRCLEPNIQSGGPDAGLRGFLVAMLLSPEFLFRMELGLGPKLPDGRRMLSPHELAYALSYALHDHPVESILKAADNGQLVTREDVEREVRDVLDSDELYRGSIPAARRNSDVFWQVGKLGMQQVAKPRMLRFFREYFDYAKAVDVFKDDVRHGGDHNPRKIVEDADWLVLSVLAKDRDVLAELLTTDEFPVLYGDNGRLSKKVGYTTVYNFTEPGWPTDRAAPMPKGQRAGILTHPAWLVAHSGNFENDPVRRGKWIQEHLLAGVVADVPIGVEAQLPDAPHKTLRQRFDLVKAAECWRCHKKMNPLGDPFENYDDFGRYREKHHVDEQGNVLASVLQMGHKRQYGPGAARLLHPVDSSGELRGTGDPKLDGEVTDAVDLMHRLAKSQRVRQSFLRHVFRYWMGRNETLRDSPTLVAMDRAYVESDGSFKETLFTLLTSDSFLYRK